MTLTRRQREVAWLKSHRLLNKEIAFILDIEEKSVKFHITNIYKILNCDWRKMFPDDVRYSPSEILIEKFEQYMKQTEQVNGLPEGSLVKGQCYAFGESYLWTNDASKFESLDNWKRREDLDILKEVPKTKQIGVTNEKVNR